MRKAATASHLKYIDVVHAFKTNPGTLLGAKDPEKEVEWQKEANHTCPIPDYSFLSLMRLFSREGFPSPDT